jgi:hypothetical protein
LQDLLANGLVQAADQPSLAGNLPPVAQPGGCSSPGSAQRVAAAEEDGGQGEAWTAANVVAAITTALQSFLARCRWPWSAIVCSQVVAAVAVAGRLLGDTSESVSLPVACRYPNNMTLYRPPVQLLSDDTEAAKEQAAGGLRGLPFADKKKVLIEVAGAASCAGANCAVRCPHALRTMCGGAAKT